MSKANIWLDIASEEEQVQKFGFPLNFFRNNKEIRRDVIGRKSKRIFYAISGFRFRNLMKTHASIEETFIAAINAYVNEITDKLDLKGKSVTLVMHHSGLREESLFVHLSKNINPGEAIMSFIERFAQSNANIKIEDEMDFDLWVSN